MFVRWLLVFLPAALLFEAALYGLMGYIVGNYVYHQDWRWGVLLALPAMLVIVYFFIAATEVATSSSAGLKNGISFLVMPSAAALGIWLKVKKAEHREVTE